jgi:hypothetical protein
VKNIDDLRSHLFETLAALKDKENPMDIDRAKAVATVAGVIVDSAKVEVESMRLTGSLGSGFVPALPAPGKKPADPAMQTNVKRIAAS